MQHSWEKPGQLPLNRMVEIKTKWMNENLHRKLCVLFLRGFNCVLEVVFLQLRPISLTLASTFCSIML